MLKTLHVLSLLCLSFRMSDLQVAHYSVESFVRVLVGAAHVELILLTPLGFARDMNFFSAVKYSCSAL